MSSASVNTVLDSNLRLLTEHLGRICRLLEHQPLQLELFTQLSELHKRSKLAERRIRIRFSRGLLSLEEHELPEGEEGSRRAIAALGVDPDSTALKPCVEAARALEAFFRSFDLADEAEVYRKLRFDLTELMKLQEGLARANSPAPGGSLGQRVSAGTGSQSGERRVSAALSACPLYFILDETLCTQRDPIRLTMEVLAGGVRMLQLRFKNLSTARMLDLARRLRPLCVEKDCLLFINDRLDIALLSNADGIHVGDDDPPVADIKAVAPQLLVGATTRKPQTAQRAQEDGADYVACGSLFGSPTKPGVQVVGLRTLQQVTVAVRIPVVGIGGVTLENCHSVLEAGAQGFCSISPFNARMPVRSLIHEFSKHATHGARREPGQLAETVDTL